jgi:hypothetical protein
MLIANAIALLVLTTANLPPTPSTTSLRDAWMTRAFAWTPHPAGRHAPPGARDPRQPSGRAVRWRPARPRHPSDRHVPGRWTMTRPIETLGQLDEWLKRRDLCARVYRRPVGRARDPSLWRAAVWGHGWRACGTGETLGQAIASMIHAFHTNTNTNGEAEE